MDLVTFLQARLDDDEKRANLGPMPDRRTGYFGFHRQMREVQAKRKILTSYEELRALAESNLASDTREAWMVSAMHPTLYGVLGTFAAVYSDHPDYEPAWAT